MVAAITAVVVLIVAVVIRIVLQTPVIPTGVTSADRLLPGSCLLEPGSDEKEYTVVPCSVPHQQQIIASVDLDFPGVPFTAAESLAIYAQETCDRLLEYRLYLPKGLEKNEWKMSAVAPPTLAQYEAGDSETLCAIYDNPEFPDEGGSAENVTIDLYSPIPE